MSSRTPGRMIKKKISDSDGFASLSCEAAVLFCMLIPHYDSHGKMNGGAGYIKDEICPKIPYLTVKNIPALLKEISAKTSVKYFEHNGRWWIHSLNFLTNHQSLKEDRIGRDLLPNYPGEPSLNTEKKMEASRPSPSRETTEAANVAINYQKQFEALWVRYPNKDGKKEAFNHFKASVKTEQDIVDIDKALSNYLCADRVQRGYVKNGSTWFNNWRDWVNWKKPATAEEVKALKTKIAELKAAILNKKSLIGNYQQLMKEKPGHDYTVEIVKLQQEIEDMRGHGKTLKQELEEIGEAV